MSNDPGMSYLNFLLGSQIDLELAQARERIRQVRETAAQKNAAGRSGACTSGAPGSDGDRCGRAISNRQENQIGE